MNHTCYVIRSQKILFKSDTSLHNYIINMVAKDCHGEKMLNRRVGEYFKKEVEINDCAGVIKLIYNNDYEVID